MNHGTLTKHEKFDRRFRFVLSKAIQLSLKTIWPWTVFQFPWAGADFISCMHTLQTSRMMQIKKPIRSCFRWKGNLYSWQGIQIHIRIYWGTIHKLKSVFLRGWSKNLHKQPLLNSRGGFCKFLDQFLLSSTLKKHTLRGGKNYPLWTRYQYHCIEKNAFVIFKGYSIVPFLT